MRRPRLSPGLICLVAACSLAVSALAVPAARAECSPGQKQEADLAYASAYEFLKNRQYEQAIPRLQSVLEICPEHWATMKALGGAYRALGRLDDAKAILSRLVDMRGQQAEPGDLAALGGVLAALKEYPEARAAYMKAQVLAPDDCSILFNLGILHMAPGVEDYRQAVQTLEETLDKCEDLKDKVLPQVAKAAEMAAAKERKIGNVQRAAFYEEKQRQYSGEAGGSTGYDLVRRLMKERKYGEAVPVLENLVEKEPERPAYLHSLAICYDQVGQDAKAISTYEKYMQVRPEDAGVAGSLVMLLAESNQCGKAQEVGGRYLEQFAGRGQANLGKLNDAMGMALACANRYAEAKTYFQRATQSSEATWADFGRQQLGRMDELIAYEAAKKKQQGG